MNFLDALKCMRNGELVRLNSWANWFAVGIFEETIYDTTFHEMTFSISEMESDNWYNCCKDDHVIRHLNNFKETNDNKYILEVFKNKVTKTMTFEDALTKLKDGYAIRNLEWDKDYWIFKSEHTILNSINEPMRYFIPEQMLDNNWIAKTINLSGYKLWNSNIRYSKGSIVTYRNKLYCSVREVPPGVCIENVGYWKLINY